jgi:hypothetical protein
MVEGHPRDFEVLSVGASAQFVVAFPVPKWRLPILFKFDGCRCGMIRSSRSGWKPYQVPSLGVLPLKRGQEACPAIAMLANALRRGPRWLRPITSRPRTALRQQLGGLEPGYFCRL